MVATEKQALELALKNLKKGKISEKLALEGVGKALHIKDWLPTNMLKKLGENPEEFRLNWGKIALATAIWMQAITSTLNPILMYFQYKKDKHMSPSERTMLIAQETAKQFVHLCLHVGVMIIGVNIAKTQIMKRAIKLAMTDAKFASKFLTKDAKGNFIPDKSLIANYETAVSNIAGCFAGAVMLPILGATLFKQIDKKMGLTGDKAHGKSHKDIEKSEKELQKALAEIARFDEVSYAPSLLPHTITYHQNPVVHPNHPVHLQGGGTAEAPAATQQLQPAFAARNTFGTLPKTKPPAGLNAFQNPLALK